MDNVNTLHESIFSFKNGIQIILLHKIHFTLYFSSDINQRNSFIIENLKLLKL